MRLLLFATSCKETQSALQGGKWKNTFHAYPAQMAFPMGVVWTVQPFWSHHPRYPLPEVRVAAPCVDGDFRVEACSVSAAHSTQTSVWQYLQPHHAPHLFAEGPAVWLAIWRIWAAFANSQMLKQTQILRPICTDCLRHLRHLLQRGWRNGCCRAGCWLY